MFTRIVSRSWLAMPALAFGLWMSGCQNAEAPEAETVLTVKLNDSLKLFERVVVQIVDRNNPDLVLKLLFDGELKAPGTDIQPYALKALANQSFIVNVTAYKAQGQLALHTQIFYEAGKKSVLHKDVPVLIPHDWLTNLTSTAGALTPAFNKDTGTYRLTVAAGATVAFTMTPFYSGEVITFEGETVPAGTATKPVTINSVDTVTILVTDLSTGVASTRTYRVILTPTLPPGLYLGSLKPSAGILTPDFRPEQQIYSLMLPPGVDTVAFIVTPADPRTMTMTVSGKAILPGQRSQTFKVEQGSTFPIPIEVYRGGESSYYQVTVDLSK